MLKKDWTSSSGELGRSTAGSLPSLARNFGGGGQNRFGVFRIRPKLVGFLLIMILLTLIFLLLPGQKTNSSLTRQLTGVGSVYNQTYPLTAPEQTINGRKYRIGLISDLDKSSKSTAKDNLWNSYFLKGYLTVNSHRDHVLIELDEKPVVLNSQLAQGGRGMELSELLTFNGKLYSVDDRTGVVYEILNDIVIPSIILSDGNGKHTKGFKCEWMSVCDEVLYVGGLGKEWTTTSGELVNLDPQWVKLITHQGAVHHMSWVKQYNAMRNSAGCPYPGYMIHEAGVWSSVHRRWYFLPRRASKERYEEQADEHRATNLIITSDADFRDISVNKIGVLNTIRGFSSFKFVPGTGDTLIVALKTEEDRGNIATYYTVFNISGKILVPDTKFADVKYEGIEFI